MKVYCCVPKCKNHSWKTSSDVSWHRIPKNENLKKAWLVKIRRDVGPNFQVSRNTRICSDHFRRPDFRPFLRPKRKVLKDIAIPSLFPWTKLQDDTTRSQRMNERRNKKANTDNQNGPKVQVDASATLEENEAASILLTLSGTTLPSPLKSSNNCMEVEAPSSDFLNSSNNCMEVQAPSSDIDTQKTSYSSDDKLHKLHNEIKDLKIALCTAERTINHLTTRNKNLESRLLRFQNIEKDDKLVNHYTGLPDSKTFAALFGFLRPKAEKLNYWRGKDTKEQVAYHKESQKRPGLLSLLTCKDMLFLVLCRLKTNMSLEELSRNFGVSKSIVSNVFTTWITFLFIELKELFLYPDKQTIYNAYPKTFKSKTKATVIIDCSEIRVERPFSLKTQREMFSTYKHYTTMKFLIGITPGGLVSFISPLYGGSTSDKKIFSDCGLRSLLTPGDVVMADKGFEVEDLLPDGVLLEIPPKFLKATFPQMSVEDVSSTRKIASIRVHVERAIARIKSFRILSGTIPLSLKDVAEQIVTVCSLLTNFKRSLIKE